MWSKKLSYFENDKHVKLNSLAIPSSLDTLVYCDCNLSWTTEIALFGIIYSNYFAVSDWL